MSHISQCAVFVPLAKSIKQAAHKTGKKSVAMVQKKIASTPKKTKIQQPKKVEKKSVVKPAPSKQAAKPINQEKKQEKKIEKKEIKKPEVKPEIKKEPVENKTAVESVVPAQPDLPASKSEKEIVPTASDEIVYIGQAERDALYMESLIRREVESKWRPPAGLSKDLECDIQLEVDWNGKAGQITVIRASGVLVYDISARSAIKAMSFPPAMHGKKFCMNFRQ
jgi:outer membrane biosynthesis protein TonB